MCGRFALDSKVDELIADFVGAGGDYREWTPSWNIAPTDPVIALFESAKPDAPVERRAEIARWSLVPSWSKEPKMRFPTFNARAEELASKSIWKKPLASHRAIMPATGYYEWHTDETTGVKTPYFVHLPGELIGMAGLYSWWRSPEDGEWMLTVTILTSDAVDQLVGIHDRNPVPLPRELWDWWVDPTITGDQTMADAAVKAALPVAESLELYRVAPIRSSTVDGPQLIEPA